MGLSDDQKALLRLLAGGQGYEDIAALLGTSVDEVKAKAAGAVEQLEAEGIPAPTLPEMGPKAPAAPKAPEPVAAAPTPEPEPPVVPGPTKDPEPPSDPPSSTAIKPPAPPKPAAGKLSLPSDPGRRAAIAAGAIVLALIVVVLILTSGGGGSDNSGTTSAATTSGSESTESGEAQNAANAGSAKLTKAVLAPVGGGSGSGIAIFGRVKKSLALQVQAQGLEPSSKGDAYTVWLAQSPQKMLPLASTAVKKDGKIAAQFEVPVEVLAYLANGTFDQIVLTKTDTSQLEAALEKATKEEQAPSYTGEAVLSGQITGRIVGAQKRIEEKEAAEKKK